MKFKYFAFSLLLFASPAIRAENVIALSDIDTAIRKICEEANKKGAFDLIDHVKPCIQLGIEVGLSINSPMAEKEAIIILKKATGKSDILLTLACRSLLEMIDMHHDLQLQEQELQRLFGWSSSEAYKHSAKIMHTVVKEKAEQLWFISQVITGFNDEKEIDSLLIVINKEFSTLLERIEETIEENRVDNAPTIQSMACLIGYRYALLFDEIKNQTLDTI